MRDMEAHNSGKVFHLRQTFTRFHRKKCGKLDRGKKKMVGPGRDPPCFKGASVSGWKGGGHIIRRIKEQKVSFRSPPHSHSINQGKTFGFIIRFIFLLLSLRPYKPDAISRGAHDGIPRSSGKQKNGFRIVTSPTFRMTTNAPARFSAFMVKRRLFDTH